MCSETTSPRISFSNDIDQEEEEEEEEEEERPGGGGGGGDRDTETGQETRKDATLLDSDSDFEFCTINNNYIDSEPPSLADELFADGMILPFQVQLHNKINQTQTGISLPPLLVTPCVENEDSTSAIKTQESSDVKEIIAQEKQKSFWGFKRSSSLNYDIKSSLICSLPLLSRSNSTGSVLNPKRTSLRDANRTQQSSQKHHQQQQSKSSGGYAYSLPQKPPLKKSYINGSVQRISPVLNVPPPYISKGTASLFGLGSLLKNSKEKKTKK